MLSRELIYLRIPIIDGSGNSHADLTLALKTSVHFIENSISTLIACRAGMSRSPAVASVALSLINSQSPDSMLQKVIKGHPHDISTSLWSDLVKVYQTLQGERIS